MSTEGTYVNVVLNVNRNHKAYWGRGEEGGEGVRRWGKREIIYLSLLHCHNQNDSCIKMGSDESHVNISKGNRQLIKKRASRLHTFISKRNIRDETTEPLSSADV